MSLVGLARWQAISINGFAGFEKLIIDWSFLILENTQHCLAAETIRPCGRFGRRSGVNIHWYAKIKDEVEKLAYQLNEEAERTERPIRRLSKVMYGSTCADMQVDVMGGV
ncbi:uncharacterized protein TNCV_3619811 [Trichonephila clavipes]|nr:uncharacterized protein TNCV_3619811 [Trichonephila clavipes]